MPSLGVIWGSAPCERAGIKPRSTAWTRAKACLLTALPPFFLLFCRTSSFLSSSVALNNFSCCLLTCRVLLTTTWLQLGQEIAVFLLQPACLGPIVLGEKVEERQMWVKITGRSKRYMLYETGGWGSQTQQGVLNPRNQVSLSLSLGLKKNLNSKKEPKTIIWVINLCFPMPYKYLCNSWGLGRKELMDWGKQCLQPTRG